MGAIYQGENALMPLPCQKKAYRPGLVCVKTTMGHSPIDINQCLWIEIFEK